MTSRTQKITTYALAAGCILFAVHVLFSAISAFSAQNFLMSDYGVYTNTLYNLARGNGFKFLVDHSYLRTHLSFSLILLTPLFWFIRHPTLLIFVQWLFLIGGCAILYRIMRKTSVPAVLRAAILFFVCAYPMTQSVMLSEFHGVSAYYLLLPWLLHEIMFRKRLVILPLICILGLREEAGIIILPMLLYAAFAHKWRTGFIMAGVSTLYAVIAVTVLFPLINGVSLFEVRAMEASTAGITSALGSDALITRAEALIWVILPIVPFIALCGRKSLPIALFPLTALTAALLSGMTRQHSLTFHYPAPIIAAMACGMVLALRGGCTRHKLLLPSVVSLILLIIVAHSMNGFFMGSRSAHPVYASIDPRMKPLMNILQSTPKTGMLLAHRRVAPYFSMREDVMVWRYFDRTIHDPDIVVCDLSEFYSKDQKWLRSAMQEGEYGVTVECPPYLLIERGANSSIDLIKNRTVYASLMQSHGGDLDYSNDTGLTRYWCGLARKAPITIAYGVPVPLMAGSYEATFRIKATADTPAPEKGFGVLSIHPMNQAATLAEAEAIPSSDTPDFFDLVVPFTIDADMDVEPRVTGGGAELWLSTVTFRRVN